MADAARTVPPGHARWSLMMPLNAAGYKDAGAGRIETRLGAPESEVADVLLRISM
jgi:hypothetical protein